MDISITIIQGFLSGVVTTWIFEQILKRNKKLRARYYRHHEILFGYHVHHSTYGLIAIIVSIFLLFSNHGGSGVFWFMLGAGIIFEHTISDGRFIFIEKYKPS